MLVVNTSSGSVRRAKALSLAASTMARCSRTCAIHPPLSHRKRTDQCKELEDSDAARQRSPGLCRDKAEARRRNHLSYTMIPPATGCSPLCYCEAPKRIGLTMVSILAAISSAGTRFGDWNQRRAGPKTDLES